MADLEEKLARVPRQANKLIITDGIFSMEGDLCDLPRIVQLARRYGAQVMVDDAHGIGVIGPGGCGTAAHFGLTGEVDLIMGTFSKSLAAIGGFIAGRERVINYLMHMARPFVFSASASPASVAAVLGALDVMAAEPERRQRLWENARFLKQGFQELGFDTGKSESPIIPIVVGDWDRCLEVWRFLQEEGIFVNPVLPPAVPPGRCMIRISVTAGHTREQLAGPWGASPRPPVISALCLRDSHDLAPGRQAGTRQVRTWRRSSAFRSGCMPGSPTGCRPCSWNGGSSTTRPRTRCTGYRPGPPVRRPARGPGGGHRGGGAQ